MLSNWRESPGLDGQIFSTSGTKAGNSSHSGTPGNDIVDFWGQGQKDIKSGRLGLILSTSGAKATKS